jgi:hypothetical protein
VGEDGQDRKIGQLTETEIMMEQDNEEITIDEEMEQLDSTAPDLAKSPTKKLALEVDDLGYTSPLPSPSENRHEADKAEYADSEIPLIELDDLGERPLSCMCSDDDQSLPAPASESTRYSEPLRSLEEVEYSTDNSSIIECSGGEDEAGKTHVAWEDLSRGDRAKVSGFLDLLAIEYGLDASNMIKATSMSIDQYEGSQCKFFVFDVYTNANGLLQCIFA